MLKYMYIYKYTYIYRYICTSEAPRRSKLVMVTTSYL
jgi:hypothetical protein